jgi:ankyrin repeat protein
MPDLEKCKALYAVKPDCILEKRDGGNFPIHIAAKNGYYDCLKFLLKKRCPQGQPSFVVYHNLAPGPNQMKDAKNNFGCTPLYWATKYGYKRCVKLLLREGADIDAPDNDGWTPLHLAAHGGHKECVKLLLRAGANVNAKTCYMFTPLCYAVHKGQNECVKLLLRAGTGNGTISHCEFVPVACPSGYKFTKCLYLLLKAGAKLQCNKSSTYTSPLHPHWENVYSIFLLFHFLYICRNYYCDSLYIKLYDKSVFRSVGKYMQPFSDISLRTAKIYCAPTCYSYYS